jgi:hypothetical protein
MSLASVALLIGLTFTLVVPPATASMMPGGWVPYDLIGDHDHGLVLTDDCPYKVTSPLSSGVMAITVKRHCLAEMFNQAMHTAGLGGGGEKALVQEREREMYLSGVQLHIGDNDLRVSGNWQVKLYQYVRIENPAYPFGPRNLHKKRHLLLSASGGIAIPWHMSVDGGQLTAKFGEPSLSFRQTGWRHLLGFVTGGVSEVMLGLVTTMLVPTAGQTGLNSMASALPTASELIDQNADKLHEWATTQRAGVTREVVVDLAKRLVAPALTMHQTGGNLILSLPLAKMNLRGLKVEL